MTSRATTLFALVLALLLVALAARSAAVAWMAVPLLTTLAWAAWQAPRRGAVRLEAVRRLDRVPGGVEVTVTVRHAGAAAAHLRIEDEVPAGLALERGSAAARWVLRPGEEATLRYALRPRRGRVAWRVVHAAGSDPLGLLENALELEAPGEVDVLPEAARLRPLPLRPERTLPLPGAIPARVGGSGTDFHGVRAYQVGDALRWLDWRRMARHPGALFTREFEQERIADVGLVLDGRSIPGAGSGDETVLDHAVRAAASLAATFLRQGNRVSLLVLGDGGARVYPGAGRGQLRRVLTALAVARPSAYVPLRAHPRSLSRLLPAGAIVFVVTPLTADDPSLLPRLRAGGRQVVVVSPDPLPLHAPARARDRAGRLALRAARVERRLALRAVAQLRIPVVDWEVGAPLEPLLRMALRPARRGGKA